MTYNDRHNEATDLTWATNQWDESQAGNTTITAHNDCLNGNNSAQHGFYCVEQP